MAVCSVVSVWTVRTVAEPFTKKVTMVWIIPSLVAAAVALLYGILLQ
eukprot:CAMPEP_0198287752 /NCGR_PEP_ID=MMETSP1449-20131203/6466_1 /TAXON_ID=420275 /ORGANISM="Attheya septentrionalis, Strain CCMP2084" /LENGTH=46 /DNA_ID= /DNA_START= /DNA_END= /DNA_ORIENTATION=